MRRAKALIVSRQQSGSKTTLTPNYAGFTKRYRKTYS